jgi:hypothetical protein
MSALREGAKLSRQTKVALRFVYWNFPNEVRSTDIATAFANELHILRTIVGPLSFNANCRECGKEKIFNYDSRTQLGKLLEDALNADDELTLSYTCGDCRSTKALEQKQSYEAHRKKLREMPIEHFLLTGDYRWTFRERHDSTNGVCQLCGKASERILLVPDASGQFGQIGGLLICEKCLEETALAPEWLEAGRKIWVLGWTAEKLCDRNMPDMF